MAPLLLLDFHPVFSLDQFLSEVSKRCHGLGVKLFPVQHDMSLGEFETWLRMREIPPSIATLSRIAQEHTDRPMTLKTIVDSIRRLGIENLCAYTAHVYLHNQYFPCLREEEKQTILRSYEQTITHDFADTFFVSNEALLQTIASKCGISTRIQKSECPICLAELDEYAPRFLACMHAYHEQCLPKRCSICQ